MLVSVWRLCKNARVWDKSFVLINVRTMLWSVDCHVPAEDIPRSPGGQQIVGKRKDD